MKQFIFFVSGMSCAMCENHINDVIRRTCDVYSVKSSRKKNETVVNANTLDVKAIIIALSELGYEAKLIKESDYEKKSIFQRIGGLKKR
ncbi:MAG: heavy-metal-associated domain-containing protein [Clostridia bacterium]|nr:heavy-metal-associated domain-containing protein [Clostridia bacterium]